MKRVLAIVAVILSPLVSCSSAQTQQAVPAGVDLAGCILSHVAGCATATPPTPWTQCTIQTAIACGTDAASVVSIWAAHKQAEMREADAGTSYP